MMQENSYNGLVSIGLPTYNRPNSLKKALEIVTSQTYKNLEIIVSDNNSTNPSVREIVELFAESDPRIKYFKQANNTGVLANAEFVLDSSSGEYFAWFSDDDWRSPEYIESMVDLLENNKDYNVAFCDYHEVYEDGTLAEGYPKSHIDVFKPFQSRNRLVRITNYYWQNPKLGKCNIFYGLFRKSALDSLDICKLTQGYKHLNMDNLIVFSILQLGPLLLSPDAMCSLTCGNQKYYQNESLNKSNKPHWGFRLFDHYRKQKKDRNLYLSNTGSLIEKLIIYLLFIPKFIREFGTIAIRKLIFQSNIFSKKSNNLNLEFSFNKNIDALIGSKLTLPNVTLVAVATRNVEETLKALLYSCKDISFGKVKLLSHYTPYCNNEIVDFVRINQMKNINEWSHFIVYDLGAYIDTDYILLVHADGFVVNANEWRSEFLNFDYIGSPWPLPKDDFSYRDINGELIRVGNSVSLRSKKLLDLPKLINIPWESDNGYFNEDGFVCVKNKHLFEENGIKFAKINIAKYFAHEAMIPEIKNIKPFAFHKWEGSNSKYPKF
jgi:glycosyltransferase involved in cell wall biosynthesis